MNIQTKDNSDLSKPPKKEKRPPKRIKAQGKHAIKWTETRKKWLEINKAPYYFCYLCGKLMTRSQLTLDHVIPRSRAPHLRYSLKNLKPCCFPCNSAKGSKVLALPESREYKKA